MKFIKTSIILIPMAPELSSQKLIYSNAELKDMGFSYYKIAAFVEQGILIKLNKSHYENQIPFVGHLSDTRDQLHQRSTRSLDATLHRCPLRHVHCPA